MWLQIDLGICVKNNEETAHRTHHRSFKRFSHRKTMQDLCFRALSHSGVWLGNVSLPLCSKQAHFLKYNALLRITKGQILWIFASFPSHPNRGPMGMLSHLNLLAKRTTENAATDWEEPQLGL